MRRWTIIWANARGNAGLLYHERGRGVLAQTGEFVRIQADGGKKVISHVADKEELIRKGYYQPQEWNEYTIIARGNHIVQILNGYPMVEIIDEDPAGCSLEGILALQIHTGPPMQVEFKDIRVRHLKEEYESAILLSNGKDLTGWTISGPELKDTWSVKDGALFNTGEPMGYLRTEQDYENFVFRMQFRHLNEGNSGVLLRIVGEDKVWPRCVEAQLMSGHVGDIWNFDEAPLQADPKRTRGQGTEKMHPSNEREVGQWNEYDITINQDTLEFQLNNLLQNTASKCDQRPGKIGIQSEGAKMEYRNLVLIPIKKTIEQKQEK